MLRASCLVLLAIGLHRRRRAGASRRCAAALRHSLAAHRPTPSPNGSSACATGGARASTRFDINSSRQNPLLGNPTSTLTYDGIDANSLEFVLGVRNETRTFFKGFVGGGWLDGGSLDDEDFFAGQIKFSDTYSELDGDGLVYGTMDVGQDFTLDRPRAPRRRQPLHRLQLLARDGERLTGRAVTATMSAASFADRPAPSRSPSPPR